MKSGTWTYITAENKDQVLQEVFNELEKEEFIGFDTETEGLDPYRSNIILYQFGIGDKQYVINNRDVPVETFKKYFEDESYLFIGHNLKFDLKFLLHKKITVKRVWDTYVTEQILLNGLDMYYPHKSLDYVCKRHTGVFLDKSLRRLIFKGITATVLQYAADDVKYLKGIMESQHKEAQKKELELAIRLNNSFVPVIAYLEYCGFKLDKKAWLEKVENDQKELKEALNKLNGYIIKHNIKEFIDPQLDLFSTEKKVLINWNSQKQVIKLFKSIGIDTKTIDPETGDVKDSVEANLLRKQDHELISLYIRYKELQKRVSTYGLNWMKFIHPLTGRIHTKFQQWVTTGRMSSGGKEGDIQFPNAQNIPSDDETRRCIVAEEGYTLIDADYDSQEVRVFTNFCRDEALIKMFNEGYKDMHSYTAWYIFPHIKERFSELTVDVLKNIKEEFPKERHISKLGNFAIQYGGTGVTIAENCNIPLEDGEAFYKRYFETFRGVKRYFNWIYETSKLRGFIQYNNYTKEKFFIPKGLKDSKLKNYAYNYPVQGTSAAITKLAGILYWKHLVEEELVHIVKIVIICHDEYLIEVPEAIAEREALILKQCMEEAGKYYCEIVPLTASPVITKFWKH